jgi:folate-binding protein YgfZ
MDVFAQLRRFQLDSGAVLNPFTSRISHYGFPQEEGNSFPHAPHLLDFTSWGALRIQGKDRIPFINRLVTIELKNLNPHHFTQGFWISGKGRFEHRLFFYATEDALILLSDQAHCSLLKEKIEKFHFGEDLHWEELPLTGLSLQGKGSKALLESLPAFTTLPEKEGTFSSSSPPTSCWIGALKRFNATEGYDLWIPHEHLLSVFKQLHEKGAIPLGEDYYTLLRIHHKEPEIHKELTPDLIPLEIPSLVHGVSFNKGCFPGQEVLARMHNLGHPNKVLCSFKIPLRLYSSKDPFLAEEKPAGFFTSFSTLPLENYTLALGFLNWRAQKLPLYLLQDQKQIPLEKIS